MGYAQMLRERFPALAPVPEDLFLLEAHEVAELPQRLPARELAAVLHAHPALVRFFGVRHPPIRPTLDHLLATHEPVSPDELTGCVDAVVWEIAEWIVYQRAPAYYDERADIPWDPAAITTVTDLQEARVIDAGAGTGRVALSVAPFAREVVAVEPVAALRRYLREQAAEQGLTNLYVVDGFLHALPMPPGTADVLLTCQAIGWNLEAELPEIERVVAPGGVAMHVVGARAVSDPTAWPVAQALLAHGYDHDRYLGSKGPLHRFTRWH